MLKLGFLFYNQNAQIVCWVLQNTIAFSHFVFYHKNNKMDLADGTRFQHKSLLRTAEFGDFAQKIAENSIPERQITLKLGERGFIMTSWFLVCPQECNGGFWSLPGNPDPDF